MRQLDAKSGLEIIDRAGSVALLAQECVGRLAVMSGGQPEIFPVNYAVAGDTVVFRTAAGTKLESAIRAPVAFEVDRFDATTRSGWSVVVHGRAEVIDHFGRADVVRALEALPVDPWAEGTKEYLVTIVPTTITGRRVGETI